LLKTLFNLQGLKTNEPNFVNDTEHDDSYVFGSDIETVADSGAENAEVLEKEVLLLSNINLVLIIIPNYFKLKCISCGCFGHSTKADKLCIFNHRYGLLGESDNQKRYYNVT
jgi:hypothetical protein